MAKTEFGVNHPLAVKVWSKKLLAEAIANTWIGKFIGNSKDSLIYRKDELSKNAGDQVVCGLRMRLVGESPAVSVAGSPTASDTVLFRIKRNGSHVNDTLPGDARLIGVEIYVTTDSGSDA